MTSKTAMQQAIEYLRKYNLLSAAAILEDKFLEIERSNQSSAEYDLEKLYEWLMDENRKKAITYFTSGTARNIASEIEFRLPAKNSPSPSN